MGTMRRSMPLVWMLLAVPAAPAIAQEGEPPDSAVPVPPIVVTVTRAARAAAEVPHAVSVLPGGRIVRAGPGLSLSAALAVVPGVTSQNRYNAARDESIAIRGFGARAAFGVRGVRILLDGIPQTLPDGQGQLTNIDLRRIDRIEVLRGAASALYGNAAGGVISLWSRADAPDAAAPDARAFAGSDGLRVVDAGVSVPVGSGSVTLRGSRTRSDGFRAQSRAEIRRASAHAAFPVGGTTRVVASLHLADLPIAQDPGALTLGELAADRTQARPSNVPDPAGLVDGAWKDVFQGQAGVTVEHALRGGGAVRATGFGLRRDLLNTLSFATIDLERWAYGARTLATLPIPGAAAVEVTLGADAQWQRDDRRNTSPDGTTVTRDQFETVRELGPFVQVRTRPHPRIALTAGARYDAVRFAVRDRLPTGGDDSGVRSMTAWSGSGGVTFRLVAETVVYASVGTAFEAPTTTELANRPDGSGGFNPDLEPQRATHYEIGVRGRAAVIDYSIAAYRADVRGALIPFEVPDVPGRRFFRNAGESRHRGAEISAAVEPVTGVSIGGALTAVDLEFVDFATDAGSLAGNAIPGVPTRFFTGSARVTRGPVRIDVEARAASSFFVDDGNSTRTASWWVMDARVGAELDRASVRIAPFAGVENLLDREYVDAVAVNGRSGRFFEPAPGRTVYVGVAVGG